MKIKEILLMSSMLLGATTAYGQYKAGADTWSVEMNYSPGGADNGRFDLQKYGARVRYHLNDNLAIRLNLGMGVNRDVTTTYMEDSDYSSEAKDYEENSTTFVNKFSLMPGVEYHFDKFERVSPFIGGELGFIAGNSGSTEDNTLNDDYYTVKNPFFGFGINFITGFDVYLCKGLYLGAELGLGYEYAKVGRTKTEVSISDVVHEENGGTSGATHDFGFNVNPSLRIGWNF